MPEQKKGILSDEKIKKQTGSSTIEMSIIFVFVFFVIYALVFLPLVYYNGYMVRASAHSASERGAMYYPNRDLVAASGSGEDIATLSENAPDNSLYFRFFEKGAEERLADIKEYTDVEFNQYARMSSESLSTSVQVNGIILDPQIEVTMQYPFGFSIEALRTFMGFDGERKITIKSRSTSYDPAEIVRLSDFAKDYIKRLFKGE